MTERIQRPLDSPKLTLILNRIIEMEEPYLSSLSNHMNIEIGTLQKYTETMLEEGWISKEKKGRKAIFEFQPDSVWATYPRLDRILENWESLDDRVKNFLTTILKAELVRSVSETKAPKKTEEDDWTKATDIGLGTSEPVYLRPRYTLRELLQEIEGRVENYEEMLSYLDEDKGLKSTPHFGVLYAEAYVKSMSGEWTEEDLQKFANKIEENPYEYF